MEADSSCPHVNSRYRCSDLTEAWNTINQVYYLYSCDIGMFTSHRIAMEDISSLLLIQLKIPLWRPRRHLEYDYSGIIFMFLESWNIYDWWIHNGSRLGLPCKSTQDTCVGLAGAGNVINYTYPLCSWRVRWFMGSGSAVKVELEPPSKLPQDIDVAASLAPATQSITHVLHVLGELEGSWVLELSQRLTRATIQVDSP
jgi:hypothetical protein